MPKFFSDCPDKPVRESQNTVPAKTKGIVLLADHKLVFYGPNHIISSIRQAPKGMAMKVEELEKILNCMIESSIISPADICCAVHNVFCHGDAFQKFNGTFPEDKHIGYVVDRMSEVLERVRKVEEGVFI